MTQANLSLTGAFNVDVRFGGSLTHFDTTSFQEDKLVNVLDALSKMWLRRCPELVEEIKRDVFVDYARFKHYLTANVTVTALTLEGNSEIANRFENGAYVNYIAGHPVLAVVGVNDRVKAHSRLDLWDESRKRLPSAEGQRQHFLTESTFDPYIRGLTGVGSKEAPYRLLILDVDSLKSEIDAKKGLDRLVSLFGPEPKGFDLEPYLTCTRGCVLNDVALRSGTFSEDTCLKGLHDYPFIVDLTFRQYTPPSHTDEPSTQLS